VKLDKRHLSISLMLLVGSVVYNAWVFTRPASGGTASRSTGGAGDVLPLVSQTEAVTPTTFDPTRVPAPADVELDRRPEWRRNPFATTRRAVLPSVEAVAPAPAPAPTLETDPLLASILYSSSRRLAVLDGRIVRVGETVGGSTVVDILPNAVVVESPVRGRRTLELRLPDTRITPPARNPR
jgi:hypothetical protein